MVGGLHAFYNLLPFIVEIFIHDLKYHHHCSGALIAHDWVLTAAHCVKTSDVDLYFLGAGRTSNLHVITVHGFVKFQYGQSRRVAKIIHHDQYDMETYFNDIALVKPRVSFYESVYLSPVALPLKEEEGDLTNKFKYCYSGGWGHTGPNYMLVYDENIQNWTYNKDTGKTTKLVHVVLPLISNKQCKRLQYRDIYIGYDIIDTQICTLYYPGRKSMCRGDSGGPLVCGSKLYGIATWSYSCGAPRIGADVFTRVDKYLVWINRTMEKNRHKIDNKYDKDLDDDYYDMRDLIEFRSSKGSRHVSFIITLIFHYLLIFVIM